MSLYVECLGEGDPLFLFHGWGHTMDSLKPLGRLLASSFQIHLFDLPGFGRSAAPGGVWDTFQYAERIVSYMNERKIKRADIIGHSFGGKVALSMAIKYPKRVQRLVLMATSGFRSRLPWNWRFRARIIKWLGKSVKTFDKLRGTNEGWDKFVGRFGSDDYRHSGNMRPILVKSIYDDLTDDLKKVVCPSLILWGSCDRETPLSIARHLHKKISGSRLIIYPNKGHLLFDDVGAHLCAHHILSFLGEKARA